MICIITYNSIQNNLKSRGIRQQKRRLYLCSSISEVTGQKFPGIWKNGWYDSSYNLSYEKINCSTELNYPNGKWITRNICTFSPYYMATLHVHSSMQTHWVPAIKWETWENLLFNLFKWTDSVDFFDVILSPGQFDGNVHN